MRRVGFKPTAPVFERAKTDFAVDRVDTVKGFLMFQVYAIDRLPDYFREVNSRSRRRRK
jgi:hypothetical protein